jgi:acetyl-CoA C-acetyltransferase
MTIDQLDRVAVVASSVTELRSEWASLQHVDLISRAVAKALAGSGLRMDDVDFVINSGSDVLDGRSISNCGFLGAMGAHHKEESRVEEDGLWSLAYATTKIAGGSARVGLVVAYSKPSESDLSAFSSTLAEPFYQRPIGLDHVVAHGLLADRYLTATGADPAVFDTVTAHAWAAVRSNPLVASAGVVGAAEIAASPIAASPLKELHLSRPVDGAVAVLLATEEIAHRVTPSPVWITGFGSSMDSQLISERVAGRLPAAEIAAGTALRRAGLPGAHAVDVVEVSGGSAAGELMVLEALGLAGPGRGVDLYGAAHGPAINPSGGALPADPVMATGLIRLVEAAYRLTGRAEPGRPAARRALVHGSSGLGLQNHCVFTLEV